MYDSKLRIYMQIKNPSSNAPYNLVPSCPIQKVSLLLIYTACQNFELNYTRTPVRKSKHWVKFSYAVELLRVSKQVKIGHTEYEVIKAFVGQIFVD